MAKEIDVYREWLGIKDPARPLNYYQLLRLKMFEDNAAQAREHYRQMNSHVRKFGSGDYAKQSQTLLNELAKAMLCLTDAQRKAEYDASLGRKEQGAGKRRTLEQILLANKTIDPAQLEKARSYAKAIGLEVRDALVQQKVAAADVVMLAFAESIGLPFIDLAEVGIDESLVPKVPVNLARQHSCVPVMEDQGKLLMASSNPLVPDVEEELRLRFGVPVRTVLCTPAVINAFVTRYYSKEAAAAPAAKAPDSKKKSKPEPMIDAPKLSGPKFSMPSFSLPSFLSFGGGRSSGSSSGGGGKNGLYGAIFGFNLTVIAIVVTGTMMHWSSGRMYGGAIGGGAAVAAIAYFVGKMM